MNCIGFTKCQNWQFYYAGRLGKPVHCVSYKNKKEKTMKIKVKNDFSIMESECVKITLKAGEYDFAVAKEQYEKINEQIKAPFRETFKELIQKFPADFERIYNDLKFTINVDIPRSHALDSINYYFENFNKEKTMKVRAKKDVVIIVDSAHLLNFPKDGLTEMSFIQQCIGNKEIFLEVANSFPGLFEIIEDWKPDGFCENERKSYHPGKGYCKILSKKERALRKLRQIANYLNGDWKPEFKSGQFENDFLYYDHDLCKWSWDSTLCPESVGSVFFKDLNSQATKKIIDLMNNGDGVCMNDLLED